MRRVSRSDPTGADAMFSSIFDLEIGRVGMEIVGGFHYRRCVFRARRRPQVEGSLGIPRRSRRHTHRSLETTRDHIPSCGTRNLKKMIYRQMSGTRMLAVQQAPTPPWHEYRSGREPRGLAEQAVAHLRMQRPGDVHPLSWLHSGLLRSQHVQWVGSRRLTLAIHISDIEFSTATIPPGFGLGARYEGNEGERRARRAQPSTIRGHGGGCDEDAERHVPAVGVPIADRMLAPVGHGYWQGLHSVHPDPGGWKAYWRASHV